VPKDAEFVTEVYVVVDGALASLEVADPVIPVSFIGIDLNVSAISRKNGKMKPKNQ
jgi:hypothetical protein